VVDQEQLVGFMAQARVPANPQATARSRVEAAEQVAADKLIRDHNAKRESLVFSHCRVPGSDEIIVEAIWRA